VEERRDGGDMQWVADYLRSMQAKAQQEKW